MFKWVAAIVASVVLVYSMTVVVDVLTMANASTVDLLFGGGAAFAAGLSFVVIAWALAGVRRDF